MNNKVDFAKITSNNMNLERGPSSATRVQKPIQNTLTYQIYILSGFDRVSLKNIGCTPFHFNTLPYGYHYKESFLFVVQNIDLVGAGIFK